MKKVLILLVVFGFVFTSSTFINHNYTSIDYAQNTKGIQFQKISFADALKLAKKEKKNIFLDAYASWCGPCKMMDSRVFSEARVGEFFNKNFINLKVDMEKDADGPELFKRYKVQAYPTMLFINGDGKAVHTILGFRNADAFLAEAKSGLK